MRYFYSLLSVVLSVAALMAALGFALKNAEPVTLRYYFGFAWSAPLVLVLLVAFFTGALAGIVASLSLLMRQHRRLLAAQKELKTLQSTTRA